MGYLFYGYRFSDRIALMLNRSYMACRFDFSGHRKVLSYEVFGLIWAHMACTSHFSLVARVITSLLDASAIFIPDKENCNLKHTKSYSIRLNLQYNVIIYRKKYLFQALIIRKALIEAMASTCLKITKPDTFILQYTPDSLKFDVFPFP